ncbi:dTDP-4-dehydrorhamnose reductase [Pseudonocardia sp. DSM 110487]|uniref:dTDP-4-dehydrorhamnose reductase n=1 Tax=Pseudonocardia sp. DSM 110487 TaxID=2865833 RepID=UPI0021067549|nr:dTDP-4-dehydrorhamnose reductase [Pseudonocardia sp. DSM 110487]
MRVLVLGAGGQVGRALAAALPDATALRRLDLDIADAADASIDWAAYDTIVNAAAFTDVDGAETVEGRAAAWRANATGPAALAAICRRTGSTLVHLSTEYVFDGRSALPYPEDAPVCPLSAYGASKAAGDLAVQGVERHYLVRPSWVVGDGHNFVRTMLRLAGKGVEPSVVADQVGRPTFATELACAIVHLVTSGAPYGTYHVTGGGEPASWADVARATFALAGHGDLRVTDTTTAEYFADKPHAARRPRNSVLDLSKAAAAGVELTDWRERLAEYVRSGS